MHSFYKYTCLESCAKHCCVFHARDVDGRDISHNARTSALMIKTSGWRKASPYMTDPKFNVKQNLRVIWNQWWAGDGSGWWMSARFDVQDV
jgi:hypothetical protein